MVDNNEVLRVALRESVTDVTVTPEALLPALRKRYARRVTARRAGLAATPLVVAAAVAGSVAFVPDSGPAHSGAPTSGATAQVQDMAYVAAKVTSALDNAGHDVAYVKKDIADKTGRPTVSETWVAADGSTVRKRLTLGHDVVTDEQFTPAGILVVLHTTKHYYRSPGTGSAATLPSGYSNTGIPLPAEIKRALAAGAATVAGTEVINGEPTIHLRLKGSVPGFAKDAFSDLWVSKSSYLPIRVGSGTSHQDFSWLPPTQENLALLTAPIPAGYTETDGK